MLHGLLGQPRVWVCGHSLVEADWLIGWEDAVSFVFSIFCTANPELSHCTVAVNQQSTCQW